MLELEEDELYDLHSPVGLDDRLSFGDLAMSHNVPVVVSYSLLDMETEYGFNQSFNQEDTTGYFDMMRKLSSRTINEMIEDRRRYHFYRTDVRGNLKKILERIKPGSSSANPLIYHFALYEAGPELASRSTGKRNPRIYFMLGRNGIIYPIFFDPYHEINPQIK